MKHFFKYFNSVAFLFIAVFLLGSIKVNAEDLKYGKFYYQLDTNDNATITGYERGEAGTLEIPAEIEGHPVTAIGKKAFDCHQEITGSLTIPSSVKSIGEYAFNNCTNLTGSLTISEGVNVIGEGAFSDCYNLSGSLIIPKSVTSIGRGAFSKCGGFEGDLCLPDSVTYLGGYAFYGCEGLTGTLTLPRGLTTIEDATFYCCRFTGELVIPQGVTSIGDNAFTGVCFSGTLTIPDNMQTIGMQAFWYCPYFTGNLIIPKSVVSIGESAFLECEGLNGYLRIYDAKVGNKAFASCTNLSLICVSEGCEYKTDSFDDTTTNFYVGGYVVSFDKNNSDASGSMPAVHASSKKYTLPSCNFTAPSGKDFLGWSDGTKTYKAGEQYTVPAKDVTFTAQWSKIYTVSFKGGTGATGTAPSKITGLKGDKITLPKNTFTKKGYEFTGWNDGSKTYKAGASYTISSKNVTFTAKWKKKELTKRELIEEFAERMYTKALGRDAEPDGLKYWADRLESMTDDGANMAYGFVTSPEFKARKLSKDDFIETMYQTFFGRPSDEGGKAYWMNQMNSGATEEMVLAGFVKSKEFDDLCTNAGIERGLILEDGTPVNAGIYQFVKRQYTCCLQRDGERDGMDYWAKRIATKEVTAIDTAKEFFFSAEFEAKGLNDKQYVERLYETFLGRPFDEVGYAYWNDKMAKGETRKEVLDEFAASEEFQRILQSYGL